MENDTGETELTWCQCVMTDHPFKTIPMWKRTNWVKVTVDSFQDPRPKPKKRVTFEDTSLLIPNMEYTPAVEEMSDSTSSTSHPSHQEQNISPHSPSSSPPTQLSPREALVSPTEDHTAQRQPAFIRPQDVNTQHTTGLAALVQETSLLTPYKKHRSAKRKARQAFSTMR